MSEHMVINKTRRAIEEAINPKGMSVHDGKVKIPASHADWLLKCVAQLEREKLALLATVDALTAQLAEATAECERLTKNNFVLMQSSSNDLYHMNELLTKLHEREAEVQFAKDCLDRYDAQLVKTNGAASALRLERDSLTAECEELKASLLKVILKNDALQLQIKCDQVSFDNGYRAGMERACVILEETPYRNNPEFDDYVETYERESINAIRAEMENK